MGTLYIILLLINKIAEFIKKHRISKIVLYINPVNVGLTSMVHKLCSHENL